MAQIAPPLPDMLWVSAARVCVTATVASHETSQQPFVLYGIVHALILYDKKHSSGEFF
jgi:hypothetical protein